MDTAPRLSHVGLYVHDVPKMIDFYTQVLGFVVSDGAEDGRITFLSRNPSDHHQVVLVRGRQTDAEVPMVQQVSFNVGTLPQVQKSFRKVRDAGCDRPMRVAARVTARSRTSASNAFNRLRSTARISTKLYPPNHRPGEWALYNQSIG